MINLLPTETKKNFVYARRNTRLRRWCFATLVAIIGIVAVVLFGQLYINRSIKSYAAQADLAREQLKTQKLDETEKQVTDISNSLQLVIQVLGREILFSKLIKQIGTTIPPGAALSDLSISKVQGGIDLRFNAASYQTGSQIQVNLQDPNNKIFDKADIVNISCSSTGAPDPRYPCQVTIRAQFSKNNPFLFINGQKSTGATQ